VVESQRVPQHEVLVLDRAVPVHITAKSATKISI
jgi:hypothetical protein